MEINNFIKIYDEVLPWNILSNLIRFANVSNFTEAKIGGGDENKNTKRLLLFICISFKQC